MTFRSVLLTVLFMGILQVSFAQDVILSDSLKRVIGSNPIQERVDAYWLLAREYATVDSVITSQLMDEIATLQNDKAKEQGMRKALQGNGYEGRGQKGLAIEYYKEAISLLEEGDEPVKLGQVVLDLAVLYGKDNQYEPFKTLSSRANDLFKAAGDSLNLISSNSNVGRSYQLLGQFDSAIVYLYNSVAIIESYQPEPLMTKIYLRLAGNTYNNLGVTYMEHGDNQMSLQFYNKAMELKRQLGDPIEVGNMYINLGGIMFGQNNLIAARSYLDSASENYSKASYKNGLLLCKSNSAAVSNEVGEYDRAITYAREGVMLAKEIQDKYNQSLNYYHLGTAYRNKGIPALYNTYMDSSMVKAREIKSRNMISEILNSQYEFANARGEYQRALDFRNQYFAVKDSMFQERKSKDIVEMETQYKTREKDQEIAFLNQENELKAASLERNTFLIIGLLILLGLVIVVFNFLRYRATQKAKSVLQEQKIRMREAQIKAVIDSQEQERKRFATDLHDGMGQLIAALQLNIQSMSQLNGDLSKRDELYANSTHLLKDVHREIRNIAFNLMPQTLMNEGLVAAVEELIKRINSTNQLQVKLSVLDVSQRLGEVVEVSLYRIIQEFLSNIMKYSKASQVYLGLTQHEDELVLTIEDDGIGYDLSKFMNSQGNGWRNINTRLNLIKGEMEVDTQEGRKGSSILITIGKEKIIIKKDQVTANNVA